MNAPKNGEKFLRDSGSFNNSFKPTLCGGLSGHELIEFEERRTAPSIPSFECTPLGGLRPCVIQSTLRIS